MTDRFAPIAELVDRAARRGLTLEWAGSYDGLRDGTPLSTMTVRFSNETKRTFYMDAGVWAPEDVTRAAIMLARVVLRDRPLL